MNKVCIIPNSGTELRKVLDTLRDVLSGGGKGTAGEVAAKLEMTGNKVGALLGQLAGPYGLLFKTMGSTCNRYALKDGIAERIDKDGPCQGDEAQGLPSRPSKKLSQDDLKAEILRMIGDGSDPYYVRVYLRCSIEAVNAAMHLWHPTEAIKLIAESEVRSWCNTGASESAMADAFGVGIRTVRELKRWLKYPLERQRTAADFEKADRIWLKKTLRDAHKYAYGPQYAYTQYG